MRSNFIVAALLSGAVLHPIRAQEAAPAPKAPEGMVLVPAGVFVMGTSSGDRSGENVARENADAQPQRTVTLPAFAIDKTEVTNAEYKRYCAATGYPPPPHWPGGSYPDGEANVPVTFLNWWEASAYAAWVGKRLPTEAEWEKAARGTDGRRYPWGEEWELPRVVWNQSKPQPVGSKPEGASPYGALDMAGNVYEWTADWYAAYPEAPRTFPEYGTTYKVVRGGGFSGYNSIARTFYRSVARASTRSEWIGFRCVTDIK
ncbi:MAG TPA: SUMF1/EgtB/PvdO family nonheme iron enzyme [Abditibacteriaceae bacterium]|nr:SUMF1/EgtB/PvdO family nonheme iron enzyme [Abditibacteriaceae bacterium]